MNQVEFKEYLISQGYLTTMELKASENMAMESKRPFLSCLIDYTSMLPSTLSRALYEFGGILPYSPDMHPPLPEILATFPKVLAYQGPGFLLKNAPECVTFVISDPFDENFQTILQKFFNSRMITFQYAPASLILEILDQVYAPLLDFEKILSRFESFLSQPLFSSKDDSPPQEFIHALLKKALGNSASDIHLEPEENFLRIRFRIDGVLHPLLNLPKKYLNPILICFKVMGRMNIAETRLPQSSHLRQYLWGKWVDFRISTHPTLHGENVVIRLLDERATLLDLDHLGFSLSSLQQLKKLIHQQEGLIVVTGPTGSGKTTTLYAILRSLRSLQKNILTLEQPIEYRLPFIRQTEIPEASQGLTFSTGIRSILRQDPDIILVGEIRDAETAAMAMRASMTGHLVLTTLHTHDAFGVINRLRDLGINPSHISDHLKGILAQRLVRLLCASCRTVGCNVCHHRGFKGRHVIEEILTLSPTLQQHIRQNASLALLKDAALSEGFLSLKYQGLALIREGKTTLSELENSLSQEL